MINANSLPPEMSLDEWQNAFLVSKEVVKPQPKVEALPESKEVIDLKPETPKRKGKKTGPKPKPTQPDRTNEARKARYFAKKAAKNAAN